MQDYVKSLVKKAKQASYAFANLEAKKKNAALRKMAKYLLKSKDFILDENAKDLEAGRINGLKESFLDRLALNEKRLKEMSLSLQEVAQLPDCINRVIKGWQRPNGLSIEKVRVPVGVIMVIYEARPNVTSDCIGLLFKSSNAAILRGGKCNANISEKG